MLEPSSVVIEPDSIEWGSLVHKSLERLLRPYLGKGIPIGQLLQDENQQLRLDFEELAATLPDQYQLLAKPLRFALIQRLQSTIESYLEAIRSGECPDGAPLAQEIKIRMPFPGKEYLTISGQIDRIDNREGRFHVLDYKSGRVPWSSQPEQKSLMKLGHRLQPLLYPHLYRVQTGLSSSPSFSFVFLGTEPPKEVEVSVEEDSSRILLSLASLLEDGLFIPTPTESMREWGLKYVKPCRYCQLNSLCRRFDTKQRNRNSHCFETVANIRFEAMTNS
jgi:ATP-dependent helicase/DNAse subunit B